MTAHLTLLTRVTEEEIDDLYRSRTPPVPGYDGPTHYALRRDQQTLRVWPPLRAEHDLFLKQQHHLAPRIERGEPETPPRRTA